MNFGEHFYDDFSHLNAQWNQERPAMAGLGSFFGQHEYRDVSYLNARLRPILPAQVGMGGGCLDGNSLGVDNSPFTTEQLMEMQDQLNGALLQRGYNPIKVDGKLGPATCGAIKWYQQTVNPQGGVSFEGGCAAVTAVPPSKGGGASPPRVPLPDTDAEPMRAGMFGTGGGTNWLMLGGAVAAIAVGGALIFRSSKRR